MRDSICARSSSFLTRISLLKAIISTADVLVAPGLAILADYSSSLSLCPSPLVNYASGRQTKIQDPSMAIKSLYDHVPPIVNGTLESFFVFDGDRVSL